MKTTATQRKVYWIPLPDPIKEEEVNLVLGDWTADARTTRALERQAALMGLQVAGRLPAAIDCLNARRSRGRHLHRTRRAACEWMRYRPAVAGATACETPP